MATTFADELFLSPHALEMLSVVSGVFLTRVQRRALLPILDEMLTDSTLAPIGSGPLSQADVFGATIGLAAFSVRFAPARWTFVHIPAGRSKTPDIYALSDDGAVWFLELKAVCPSDADVDIGGRLDTCRRIGVQRSRAVSQLHGAQAPMRRGPAIRVSPQGSVANSIKTNGRAFVVVVLPRAGLVSRRDIQGPGKAGCPQAEVSGRALSCSERCLSGSFAGKSTSAVALYGSESWPMQGMGGSQQVLGALRIINGGLWAGANALVDRRLSRISESIGGASRDERRSLVPVVTRYLRAARLSTTESTRERLVSALGDALEPDYEKALVREIHRSAKVPVHPIPIQGRDLFTPPSHSAAPIEAITTDIEGIQLHGVRSRSGIRLIADADAFDARESPSGPIEAFLRRAHGLDDSRIDREHVALAQHLGQPDPEDRLFDGVGPFAGRSRVQLGGLQPLGFSFRSRAGHRGWVTREGLLDLHWSPRARS